VDKVIYLDKICYRLCNNSKCRKKR